MATNQAFQEAQFGETGRQNFLQSLMGLAGQKPQTYSYAPQPQPQSSGIGGMLGGVGGAVGGAFQDSAQRKWFENLFRGTSGGPNMTSTGIRVPSTYNPRS